MKQFTTADRLKQIMNKHGMRQVDILRRCEPFAKKYGVKMTKSILSQYVSGKVEPGQDKLTILSLALGVSEAWLMGYDVPVERNAPPPSVEDLSEEEAALIELFRRVPEDKQKLVVRMIRTAAEDP